LLSSEYAGAKNAKILIPRKTIEANLKEFL
jgi:hypothetical protein